MSHSSSKWLIASSGSSVLSVTGSPCNRAFITCVKKCSPRTPRSHFGPRALLFQATSAPNFSSAVAAAFSRFISRSFTASQPQAMAKSVTNTSSAQRLNWDQRRVGRGILIAPRIMPMHPRRQTHNHARIVRCGTLSARIADWPRSETFLDPLACYDSGGGRQYSRRRFAAIDRAHRSASPTMHSSTS